MNNFIHYNLFYFLAFAIVWTIGVSTFVYVRRRGQGKPILRPDFEGALFLETWRSGRSFRNTLTFLSGAQRCIWVAVTEDKLWTGLHFPFSLMPQIHWSGLEQAIPAEAIQWAVPTQGLIGPRGVKICFLNEKGVEEQFEVNLKQYDKFLEAIATIKGLS